MPSTSVFVCSMSSTSFPCLYNDLQVVFFNTYIFEVTISDLSDICGVDALLSVIKQLGSVDLEQLCLRLQSCRTADSRSLFTAAATCVDVSLIAQPIYLFGR
jgi:hypothetical protein